MGTKIRSTPTPAVKFYLIDMLKELAKHIIRHPNRRLPSYRDWDSRSHRAVYDNEKTRRVLGWQPAGTKEAIIQFGIVASVRGYFS